MESKVEEEASKSMFECCDIEYISYGGEHHLPLIMNLVDKELSEPYSIFTYRYFVYLWPQLSFLPYRGKGIATELVTRSIKVMMESGCEEVTLEAEVTNKGALALYGRLGFIRAKRLFHYYLNGVDAFRPAMYLRPESYFPDSLMTEGEPNYGHEHLEDDYHPLSS
ncbi:hypothetical protein Leryth_016953 [Lithospermum erythrorhizon]|nr:hypothetical protein Leryth_016953 [Lithospermum erythrorhizon]